MPLLAVAATTMMDTSERLVHQDGSPGSGSGQSQVRKRERKPYIPCFHTALSLKIAVIFKF
jgi:hypothetical protein